MTLTRVKLCKRRTYQYSTRTWYSSNRNTTLTVNKISAGHHSRSWADGHGQHFAFGQRCAVEHSDERALHVVQMTVDCRRRIVKRALKYARQQQSAKKKPTDSLASV